MDELTLAARLRDGYPAGIDLTEPGRLLAAEISAATSADRGPRRNRAARPGRRFWPKLVVVGAVAATVAASTVIALQNVPARPAARPGASLETSFRRQRPAAGRLRFPGPPPASPRGSRTSGSTATSCVPTPCPSRERPTPRSAGRRSTGITSLTTGTGKTGHQNQVPCLGQLTSVFEKTVTEGGKYTYLLSLPTTPSALRADNRAQPENLPHTERGRLPPGTGNYGSMSKPS